MILKQALAAAISHLDDSAVGSPRMNGEVLLMFTLGCDRAYLYAGECAESRDQHVGHAQLERFIPLTLHDWLERKHGQ